MQRILKCINTKIKVSKVGKYPYLRIKYLDINTAEIIYHALRLPNEKMSDEVNRTILHLFCIFYRKLLKRSINNCSISLESIRRTIRKRVINVITEELETNKEIVHRIKYIKGIIK